MQPHEFVAKWRNIRFGEKQASQEMFLDICALVDLPTPVSLGNADAFTFEKWVPGGFADAYLEEHFGWEFKSVDSQLDDGLNQLLRYQVHLKTPPLLIVSSFRTIRIQTNFPGMETVRHDIPVPELDLAENLEKIRRVFHAPAEFRTNRSVEKVTRETADLFYKVVTELEMLDVDPEKLARYLNQIVFCLYAEGAGLLEEQLFTQIVARHRDDPVRFDRVIRDLFAQMADGGIFGYFNIEWFNGNLFEAAETVLLTRSTLQRMAEATVKNWRSIEPSIFGTLFERALDASKRSQLGAHYTSAEDIASVVEPVVIAPLRREWETALQEVEGLFAEGNEEAARGRLESFQQRLFEVTVLDPACGSGNFLYVALRSLLDLEKEVIEFASNRGWHDLTPRVKPDQMLGLEINPYAAELARTALWIGYIQWHRNNGFPYNQQPILTPLNTIRQTDAILADGDTANPRETEWPDAEFIIGNPPFLGGKLLRSNLGDEYVDALFQSYRGRVPAEADIVCYWFEKARAMLEQGKATRAGLLATQGIRGGANRRVLQRIKESGDIFLAWADQPWMLEGAAVHVSIVGFDDGSERNRTIDGAAVESINANLTVGTDLTAARQLAENLGIAFMGSIKVGPFEITQEMAQGMLHLPNPHGKPNSDVIRSWINGRDVTHRSRNMWIIDFGVEMSQADAALYEAPFEYVVEKVKPERDKNRDDGFRERWWLHGRPRVEMRDAIRQISRVIVTPRVSKHRLFIWVDKDTLPDSATIAIARDDDYTFGVLHSRFHEAWALAMGTQLESRPRYTPTTCFETFPFPEPDEAQREAIAGAAARLNEQRENVLRGDSKETLTKLYNKRPAWLANAHAALDAAVAAAYGWPASLSDAEVLERLLNLNLQRSLRQAQER